METAQIETVLSTSEGNKSPKGRVEEYISFGTQVFDKLNNAYWEVLQNAEDRLAFTEQMISSNLDIMSPVPSEQAMMLVYYLAQQHQVLDIWDDQLFDEYKQAIVDGKEREILDNTIADVRMFAFVSAINFVTRGIENVRDELKQGKGIMQGDFLVMGEVANPLLKPNLDDLENIKLESYNALINYFKTQIAFPFADKELFIQTEIAEFSRFFSNHESHKGWEYLCKRLAESEEDIEELYKNRSEIIDGTYTFSLFDREGDRRAIYGALLGVKEYLKFLNVQIKGNNKTEDKGLIDTSENSAQPKAVLKKTKTINKILLLPELLSNPSDIQIINNWLVEENFIELVQGGDPLRPYHWKGKSANKKNMILSSIDDSNVDSSLRKKSKTFSLPYQVARFGIILLLMKKLKIRKDTYKSTGLARAILDYYNLEDPTSTITDAFKKSKWPLSLEYANYYTSLKDLLKKDTKSPA